MTEKVSQSGSIGLREAKNRFSEVTADVNATGIPLVVTKNSRPWVVIQPADAQAIEKRRRRERFLALTRQIEADPANEPSWDADVSDKELLDEERMRRFG